MSKPLKSRMIQEYSATFAEVDGAVVVDYSGVTAEALRLFRLGLREQNLKFRVVRNALARQAFAGTPLAGVEQRFEGPSGLVYGEEAGVGIAVKCAKAVLDYNKTRLEAEWLKPWGAILEGELFTAENVRALSKMPDRDGMRAMIACAINGTASGLARCVNNVAGGITRALARKIEKEEEN
jgi:large subunit ribosomal protein L10